jgi:cbb3-type cytochrome oxidase subunit 3
MKAHLAKLFRIVVLLLILIGIIYAALPPRTDTAAQRALADTRLALRQQGFKTDLADFDFTTSPEIQARVKNFEETAMLLRSSASATHPNLM